MNRLYSFLAASTVAVAMYGCKPEVPNPCPELYNKLIPVEGQQVGYTWIGIGCPLVLDNTDEGRIVLSDARKATTSQREICKSRLEAMTD